MELRYTEQIFSEKDACLAGDLISLRNVEVYILARVVIPRVDLYLSFYGSLVRRQVWGYVTRHFNWPFRNLLGFKQSQVIHQKTFQEKLYHISHTYFFVESFPLRIFSGSFHLLVNLKTTCNRECTVAFRIPLNVV